MTEARPYLLKSIRTESGRFEQHAVIKCYNCHRTEQFLYTSPDNPGYIVKKFQQQGWEVNKNGKTRCPEHKQVRLGQKAYFAKLGDAIMPELVKSQAAPEQPHKSEGQARMYLLLIEADGSATLTEIDDAREMTFNDVEYLVVPK